MRPATGRPSCTASPLATTTRTASTKPSQPRTSSTDSKRPAIDESTPSSTVDDERTTSGRLPFSVSSTPGLANCVDGRHALVLGDRDRGVGREHEAREHGKAGLVGASERSRLGAGALGVGCIREAHDGRLGAELRVGAHHRKFLLTRPQRRRERCRKQGIGGDRLVVNGAGPRLEAQLGGATQVRLGEHGVHLAGLDAERPGPSEQRRRALGPAPATSTGGVGVRESVHGDCPFRWRFR